MFLSVCLIAPPLLQAFSVPPARGRWSWLSFGTPWRGSTCWWPRLMVLDVWTSLTCPTITSRTLYSTSMRESGESMYSTWKMQIFTSHSFPPSPPSLPSLLPLPPSLLPPSPPSPPFPPSLPSLLPSLPLSFPPSLPPSQRCCILSGKRGKLDLSLRASRVQGPDSDEEVKDPELSDLSDLKDGQLVRGYVKSVTDLGVYVR